MQSESNRGLVKETAFKSFLYGGQFILPTQLVNPIILCFSFQSIVSFPFVSTFCPPHIYHMIYVSSYHVYKFVVILPFGLL